MLAIGSAPPRKHVGTPPTSAVLRGSVCRPDDGHSHSTAARTAEKQSHLHGRFQMINSNRTVYALLRTRAGGNALHALGWLLLSRQHHSGARGVYTRIYIYIHVGVRLAVFLAVKHQAQMHASKPTAP